MKAGKMSTIPSLVLTAVELVIANNIEAIYIHWLSNDTAQKIKKTAKLFSTTNDRIIIYLDEHQLPVSLVVASRTDRLPADHQPEMIQAVAKTRLFNLASKIAQLYESGQKEQALSQVKDAIDLAVLINWYQEKK